VILCGFAAAVGELTVRRIRSDFNNQLAAATDELRDQIHITITPTGRIQRFTPPLDTFAAPEHAVIRVLRTDGTVLQATRHAPNVGYLDPSLRLYTTRGYRIAQRVIQLNGPNGTEIPIVIQYARRVSDLDATLRRVRVFLVLGVLGGTALALIAGLWLAGRAIAPVAALTAVAREIALTRDPGRRIPQPQAEDEVAELAQTLDDMLRALNASRQEMEGVLTRQREFVANASHELRTPLTSVLANLELLVDVLRGEQGEAASSALRSSQRMRRLVADLLLLARADVGREAPHGTMDLGTVLVEAAGELSPVANDHELTVDSHPVPVTGARDELHRLLVNLMENAINHTPAGTHIHASVRSEGDRAVVVVEDDGPGVPPALRATVFERFVRGDGDRGGSFGLGLSIVRAVAEGHGGSVTLEDAEPGARFIVRLPAEPAAEPAVA
jgi:signal transduction histidine kinase